MNIFIYIAVLLFPLCSFSQTSLTTGDEFLIDERRVAPDRTNEVEGDSGGEDLGSTGGFEVTQQGGLEGTNDGQAKGSSVQMLGMAMGAAFASICPQLGGQWACPLAAMSFMDAMSGGSAKQAAFETGTYIDPEHGGTGDYDVGTGSNDVLQAQAADALQNLANLGYTTNPDGSVSGPNGASYSASDYSSLDGLTGQGMSAEAAQGVLDKMNSIKNTALEETGVDAESGVMTGTAIAATKGTSSGSLSEYGAGSGANSGNKYIEEIEYRKKKSKKTGRLPASQAADLSKNFNGDPIGIGMANLFLIVHKKYKQKKTEKEFFTSEY